MRFVIHYHLTEKAHFDFMLEEDDSLLTWRIEPGNFEELKIGKTVEALRINNHRMEYLDYEGPISCGRGSINLVDTGNYKKTGENSLVLSGKIFSGNLNISEKKGMNGIFIFSYKKIT